MNRLYKKTAVVTAGAKGIGEAIVRRFAKDGYGVVFSYNTSEQKALKLSSELNNVFCIKADLSLEPDAKRLAAFSLEKLGEIDALVCNAGYAHYSIMPHTSIIEMRKVIGCNLDTAYLSCKAFYDIFVNQKKGSIVNISSVWGLSGASCETAYSAAKAGIIGLTQSLAKELAPSLVRVNAVAPGAIETDMIAHLSKAEREALISEIPLGRIGSTEDIASIVAFLASEEAGYITGQVLNVSGGLVI
ncbi:MAG: SDR family oxidoreductase [Clostridia bacterium]|nr:SDR family oxidoreductase [Clostridia bacterium]MBP5593120.1 SDR family oxidoreductase [Clostridia bacterium]MBP5648828.1 SDR family oxidoreductase [Clostridia bacterium]